MPVETPVKNYTHELILEILKPYATRGWIKRFIAVANAGPDVWLILVQDFNIQTPEVEYVVDDIVRALEPPQEENSLVRLEMEDLQSKGKLDLSTPELADEWEVKLQEEREQLSEWKAKDEVARKRQRESDLEFLANKKATEGVVIPIKSQDFKVRPINTEATVPPVPEPNAEISVEIQSQSATDSPAKIVAPVTITPPAPAPVTPKPEVEHAKELSETEKAQMAFKPKPAPEKEPEYKDPVIVSIDGIKADGSRIPAYRAPEGVETVNGLNAEGIERLKKNGIHTVTDFEKTSHDTMKSILGMPAYQSIKSKLKT